MTVLVLISLVILVTAIKGDNMLRIVLAGAGFLTLGGLLTGLLISKSRANA
jgi:hypothetical protein